MQKQALWNLNFLAICFSSFFIFMTFYVYAVTLPTFVLESLGGGQQEIGLVTTVFVIAAVIFRPLTGKWLDEWDRKKLLFLSLVLYTVCCILYLSVSSMSMLLLLRIVHGVGFGIAATAFSAIAVDTVPAERKGEGIGYFGLFMSLAMVVGPFLGITVMSSYDFTVLFGLCIAASVLSFVCGMMTRIPERVTVKLAGIPWSWNRFIERQAIPISIAASVLAFSYGAISTFISVYAKELGLPQYASYFFMVFAAIILISRPFTGKLFDRLGAHVLVYPGLVLFVGGMIGLSQAHSAFIFLLTAGIIGLGFGALLPSFQTIAIQSSPAHRSGLATGTYFVFFDTGYASGSYILGVIAAHTNYRTMYLIGGLIVALTIVIYYGLHHKPQMRSRERNDIAFFQSEKP